MGKDKDKAPFEIPGALLPAAAPRLRPSKLDPFREFNEQEHPGTGGARDFDCPGQQSSLATALHADLLPGERILRQFDVDIKIRVSCLRRVMWLLCFLCRVCLPRPIYHERRRIAITTMGRIGFFSSNLNGQASDKCFPLCCVKGGMNVGNEVSVKWFHAQDLSAVQFFYGQARIVCPPWKLLCKQPREASLRLFFHKFPSLGQMNSGNAGFVSMARTAAPGKKFKAGIPRSMFQSIAGGARSFIAHCIPGGAEILSGGGDGLPIPSPADLLDKLRCDFIDPSDTLPDIPSASSNKYSIEVVSDAYDRLHPDATEQETSLRSLYEAVVAISASKSTAAAPAAGAQEAKQVTTGPLQHFTGPDDGKPHFNIVNQPSVLLDRSGSGLPVVNVEARHLMPGEKVIDAIPWQEHQSWAEFLGTFCNFCFFCPPALNGAMILTSHRIISIFIQSASAAKGDGTDRKGCALCSSSYAYSVESLSLGDKGFQEGLLGLGVGDAALLVRTKFGGIKVRCQLRNPYPWQCSIDRNIRTRGRLFLSNFVSKKTRQVLATPPAGFISGVPEDLQQVLPLMPGESYVANMRTEGLYLDLASHYNPCSAACTCGNDAALVRCVRLTSCGRKPLEHVANVVLTTHRLLAVGFPENAPWFCKSCCTKKSLLVYWQPLSAMPGFEVNASLYVDQSCLSRVCSFLPCFSPAVADVTVDSAGVRGFPVPVQRYRGNTNEGMLDEPQVSVMRRALSLVTASPGLDASVDVGSLPGAPPPEVMAGAGGAGVVSHQNPVGGM